MPDLHKTLILAHLRQGKGGTDDWTVDELAMATEHAPWRHKRKSVTAVGSQRKKAATSKDAAKKEEVVDT